MERKSREPLERAFEQIRSRAEDEGVKIHASFFEELENYSCHGKVRELPDPQLTIVIRGVGSRAIERSIQDQPMEKPRLGGGVIRQTLDALCGDPFSECYEAARKILRDDAPQRGMSGGTMGGEAQW